MAGSPPIFASPLTVNVNSIDPREHCLGRAYILPPMSISILLGRVAPVAKATV